MKRAPLFFDLDHTLWDFESNSRRALKLGYDALQLSELGVPEIAIWIESYERANNWCWEEFRNGRMDKATLRSERFRLALRHLDVEIDPSVSDDLGSHYIQTSPLQTGLIPGTVEVLQELQRRGHDMWLLTNGFDEVQHLKVQNCGLHPYFLGVFTSDSLGVKKPHAGAFEAAAERAGVRMDQGVIMIGDSIESDVHGAQNVGWRGVHFNPVGPVQTTAWKTIRTLTELLELPLTV